MAILVNNRTQETCAAPGTGTVTLLGAVTGYRTFSAGIGANNLTYYTIADQTGSNWEVGIGTVGSGGTTLIRTTVLDSSNGGSLTNFSSGTQLVYSDYPANAAVLQTDVGTAPNQVPLNQYLGKLAFQDVLDTVSNNPYYDTQISDVEPTLNLDFVNSKTLDSRITFTRSTTATYYGANFSAVAEQNLFLYSQDFTNAAWTKYLSTITASATTAPDGTTTGQKLIGTATTNSHHLYQAVNASTQYSYSIYAKSSDYTNLQIFNDITNTLNATFDLSAGTTSAILGCTSTITSVGNGWYRCAIVHTTPASSQRIAVQGFPTGATASNYGNTFLGDGTSGVFIWGAQLEQRSSATAYNATTTTALTNYIPALQTAAINQARLDYNPVTGTPNGLLIEEQRTNLNTYSSNFSGYTLGGVTLNTTANIAPDGTQTANYIVDTTTNGQHYARFIYGSASINTAYTGSIYLKAGARTWAYLYLYDTALGTIASAYINLATGVLGTTTGTITISSVGNGWYRVSANATSSATTTGIYWTFGLSTGNGVNSYAGDGWSGIYAWGAQLEAGAFPTSYIPTVASQVTRSADAASMTGTNFSSWYNISQGSVYVEYKTGASIASAPYVFGFFNGSSNYINLLINSSATVNRFNSLNSGVQSQIDIIGNSLNTKIAIAFQGTNATGISTGSSISSSTTMPQLANDFNRIIIGGRYDGNAQINGTIKKLAYYPVALSNAELQEMTL